STACLMRPGATTHSSDSEQRLVDVPLQVTATNAVELQMPIEPTLAPPGWYLLFVATAAGVPSEGHGGAVGGTMGAPVVTIDHNATQRRDALFGRLVGSVLGAVDLLNVYLGDRLGLYRAGMADSGA